MLGPSLPTASPPVEPVQRLAAVDAGALRSIARGWLAACVPSLALFGARLAFGEAAVAPGGRVEATFALYSALVAPLWETAVMIGLAWIFARAMPGSSLAQAVALALVLALAHLPGGGIAQAIAVVWPFMVYAVFVVAWMRRSVALAFVVGAGMHALYNATFLVVAMFAGLAGGDARVP